MPVIFLLDDERSFADSRDAIITRTVHQAIEKAAKLDYVDEMWMDFVLASGDTLPFIRYLIQRHHSERPLKINKFIFHSSAYTAQGLMEILIKQAGVNIMHLPQERITRTSIGE